MTDFLWPAQLNPSASSVEIMDNAGRYSSAFSGRARTIGRPGTRTRLNMSFRNLTLEKRSLYSAIVAALGGMGRVWCHDHSHELRTGVTAFTDLVTNSTFENGTTGFTAGGSFSLAVSDRVLRATRSANTGGNTAVVRLTSAATVTPFQPYVGRMLVTPGRGAAETLSLRFGSTAFGTEYASSGGQLTAGMMSFVFTPYASTMHFGLVQGEDANLAGDNFSIPFISLQPCALVDNATNLFPYSDDYSQTDWTKTRLSIAATEVTWPNGQGGTKQMLHEDATVTSTHVIDDTITVASTADVDYCFAVAVKAANRTWVRLLMEEQTSSGQQSVYVNLSTGALGTNTTGSNWADARTVVKDLGNGWYYIAMIARKTNTATSIMGRINIASANGTVTFSGLDQDSIAIWRATLQASSVPPRLTQTTGTAISTGTPQNLGGSIYTKGWPVSTSGIRKTGDVIGLGSQFIKLTAPIDSDAAGQALVEFGGHLVEAPADNAPLILTQPMSKFMLESPENGWSSTPGAFSDAEISLVEAP